MAPYGLSAPISLTLKHGDGVTGVLGPNGAGKSTLLRLCAGLLRPKAGRVQAGGQAQPSRAALARWLAYVPQEIGLRFDFTVEAAVAMGRHPHRPRLAAWREVDQAAVEAALRQAGLLALRDRSVQRLSGGERQRVALARALAQAPKLLILDEPTAHLDVAHAEATLRLLDDAQRGGITVLVALHDLNLAARYCRDLLLLSGGRLIGRGPPSTLMTQPTLEAAFGAPLRIIAHPDDGRPQVLGRHLTPPPGQADAEGL